MAIVMWFINMRLAEAREIMDQIKFYPLDMREEA